MLVEFRAHAQIILKLVKMKGTPVVRTVHPSGITNIKKDTLIS